MKKEEPRQAPNMAQDHMLRFLKTRGGTVAFSCFQICTPIKASMSRPNRMKSTMMRALAQLYSVPPHWSASRRQMTPGMKRMVPIGSMTLSFAIHPCWTAFLRLGEVKKKKMKMAVTAPKGRLMSGSPSAPV